LDRPASVDQKIIDQNIQRLKELKGATSGFSEVYVDQATGTLEMVFNAQRQLRFNVLWNEKGFVVNTNMGIHPNLQLAVDHINASRDIWTLRTPIKGLLSDGTKNKLLGLALFPAFMPQDLWGTIFLTLLVGVMMAIQWNVGGDKKKHRVELQHTPAWELLKGLGVRDLSQLNGALRVDSRPGPLNSSIETIQLAREWSTDHQPDGVELLQSELAIEDDGSALTDRFDLIYNMQGHLIGIFPALPEKLKKQLRR